MRRRLAGGVAVVAAAAGGVVVATGGETPVKAASQGPARATAPVERTDLVDRASVAGTLGYADTTTLVCAATGTLTALRDPGSVVTRGHSLYAVNDVPSAFLFYGTLPAWRDFGPGMTDGDDVRQLERNLRELGYDPGDVDRDWTWETTDAVEQFQRDRDLDDTGKLARGSVVFHDGPARVGEAKAAVGDQVGAGKPLGELSSEDRVVSVDIDASRQRLAHAGDRVTVDLPSGRTVNGRISDVGKVATKSEDGSTITVTITLPGKADNLDQAPVDVGFSVETRKDALAVPIKALLARQGGGYAVEVVGRGMVKVTPGLYADDLVEVEGDLREGEKVVTAL
ncbi:peptidoglycan-binding protein [Solirubrobacter soli]|uniref:peptidoglycan-binding protein n=1 Tax=Solirubrobacter soli TaxID=363832 RepID=UPI0004241809|nr:peptidoglycan-binding protein [Solirubrobacter soli]